VECGRIVGAGVQSLSRAVYETEGFADYFWASTVIRIASAEHRQPPRPHAKPGDRDLRATVGVQLGAMPSDAAGLVFLPARSRPDREHPSRACRSADSIGTAFCILLSTMYMVLAKSSIAIASRYAELVPDLTLRENIFGRIRQEWHSCIDLLLKIMDQQRLLQSNPLLERSIRNRFPYLDPLNHVQVELLKEHRAQNPDEQVLRGIQITINGISAGLRNSG
jgi:phosphoenolpyruvate carboxylase